MDELLKRLDVIRRALIIVLTDDRSPARVDIINELKDAKWL